MRSIMRRILPASLALGLTGCIGSGAVVLTPPPTPCSQLVPDSWDAGVPDQPDPPVHAGLPLSASDGIKLVDALLGLREWVKFGVQERADKQAEAGRRADTKNIIARCEARDAAAVRKAKPKVLGLF